MKIVSHERDGAVVTAKADDLTFEEMEQQVTSLSFGSITSLDLSVSVCERGGGTLLNILPRSNTYWVVVAILVKKRIQAKDEFLFNDLVYE